MGLDMDDEDRFPLVDLAKLGLIEIQFHRTTLCGFYPSTETQDAAGLLSSAPVSERSKKVGWHRTAYVVPILALSSVLRRVVWLMETYMLRRLGEEKTVNLKAYVHSDLIDPLESPYLTFLLRYQPEGQSAVVPRFLDTDVNRRRAPSCSWNRVSWTSNTGALWRP